MKPRTCSGFAMLAQLYSEASPAIRIAGIGAILGFFSVFEMRSWELALLLGGAIVYVLMTNKIQSGVSRTTCKSKVAPPGPPSSKEKQPLSDNEWLDQIQDHLKRLQPSSRAHNNVQRLVESMHTSLTHVLPVESISAIVHGDPTKAQAYRVAVPEIEINIEVKGEDFLKHLPNLQEPQDMDAWSRVHKNALRKLVAHLVKQDGFRFRRSSLTSQHPRVTVLTPPDKGIFPASVAIDIHINDPRPTHGAELLAWCAKLEPLTKDLVLLVQRWARDRAVSHVAKGYFSPYVWSLLVVFFLQTKGGDDKPSLPPLWNSKTCPNSGAEEGSTMTIATLFRRFMEFYAEEFDFRTEVVDVISGDRRTRSIPAKAELTDQDGLTMTRPYIKDPLGLVPNFGSSMTAQGVQRLQAELCRASELCAKHHSVSEIFEVWCPPEVQADDLEQDGCM